MVLIWLTNVKKYPWLHFGIIPVGFGMFLGATTLSDWSVPFALHFSPVSSLLLQDVQQPEHLYRLGATARRHHCGFCLH
jgi:hypothetical protein